LEREVEEGNIEYKLKLIDPTPKRFEQLVSQLKWRLGEGQGEALYEVGVEDDGFPRFVVVFLFVCWVRGCRLCRWYQVGARHNSFLSWLRLFFVLFFFVVLKFLKVLLLLSFVMTTTTQQQ